jgi:hypothetical protein
MSKTKGIFLACLVTENRASNIRVQLILGENARRTLRCKCNKKNVFILHRKNRDSFASSEHEQGFGSFQFVPRVHGS